MESKTINELAQHYSIHPLQVGKWKKLIQDQATTIFSGNRGPKKVDNDNSEQLYTEIGKLKMEVDWLKKKSGLSLPR